MAHDLREDVDRRFHVRFGFLDQGVPLLLEVPPLKDVLEREEVVPGRNRGVEVVELVARRIESHFGNLNALVGVDRVIRDGHEETLVGGNDLVDAEFHIVGAPGSDHQVLGVPGEALVEAQLPRRKAQAAAENRELHGDVDLLLRCAQGEGPRAVLLLLGVQVHQDHSDGLGVQLYDHLPFGGLLDDVLFFAGIPCVYNVLKDDFDLVTFSLQLLHNQVHGDGVPVMNEEAFGSLFIDANIAEINLPVRSILGATALQK